MEAHAAQPLRLRLGFVVLLALLYGGAHLTWYWVTPLGRSAVLDERENLQLAVQIATGTLPPEPFYRAMGYPLLLSGLVRLGVLDEAHPQAATAAGLLLHVLNTWLVAALARRWFGAARAGWIAGLLHGLNPVLIHYATQILDAGLANTLFLSGLLCLPGRDGARTTWRHATGLSLAWSAAALVRPQLLLLWLAFPLGWLAATGAWRRQLPALLAATAAGAVLWLAQGLWCRQVGGEFRLLPWQGPYNLWAANHAGANGRYYKQSRFLRAESTHQNPARRESEAFYREATDARGPLRIGDFNRYWRDRLRHDLAEFPWHWPVLVLRKAAYLAGNFEQYNNKTYSFHQARSPWLRWNPLGWGLLLLTGTLGLVALGRTSRPLLIAAAAIAAGILLSYASARFRLPLAALLGILAGGALAAPRGWKPASPRGWTGLGTLLLGLGVLTYGGWFNGHDQSTYVQDHLLTALAAERVGEDQVTWAEARAALALSPQHPDALRLGLTSYYNLLLQGTAPRDDEPEWRKLAIHNLASHPVLVGYAHWRDDPQLGAGMWRGNIIDPEALAALVLSGAATPDEQRQLARIQSDPPPGSFRAMLAACASPQGDPELQAAAARLFRRK